MTPEMLFGARWLQGAFVMLLIHSSIGATSHARPPVNPVRRAAATSAMLMAGLVAGALLGSTAGPGMHWRWSLLAGTGVLLLMPLFAKSPRTVTSEPYPRYMTFRGIAPATISLQCIGYAIVEWGSQGRMGIETALLLIGAAVSLGSARAINRKTLIREAA
ncbi:hypothetical protein ACFV0C_38350 [Streptomyces sp. NPDC059568]|uniref:hypothetical protein n=1 Tax=Streptomyces sp. NPDC059568 TaxID=3346868 RepID=UPI00368C649D